MLRRFPRIRHSTLHRAMYIASMCFVFSYIAFDVLDLDGSNLPSFLATLERSSVVAEIRSEPDIPDSFDRIEHAWTTAAPVADEFTTYNRLLMTPVPEFSLLALARAHGFRVGLARDDLPG